MRKAQEHSQEKEVTKREKIEFRWKVLRHLRAHIPPSIEASPFKNFKSKKDQLFYRNSPKMEKYQSGVEFESPQYGGAGNKIFPAIAAYADLEEPSDLDEILATCTFKNADETELDEDELEPFYTDTIPEEETDYVWRRIYLLTEQEESKYPLPESITDSVLMDEKNWAVA
jgi:hypothetical protein